MKGIISKEEFLVMMLTHEITKEIDGEFIKSIKDPNYKPDLISMKLDEKTNEIMLKNHKKQMKLYEEWKNGNVRVKI